MTNATRRQLEAHITNCIKDQEWCFLLMNGDPSASRQRLLGHRIGPYGWVVGHVSPNNLVRFNPLYLDDYLSDIDHDKLPEEMEMQLTIPDKKFIQLHCNYRIEL